MHLMVKPLFFFLIIFGYSSSLVAQEYITERGDVSFLSVAPMNQFEGTSDYLNGLINLELKSLDFFIDLNTLKTGIGLRDRHMRDNYLETNTYPFGEFTGQIEGDLSLPLGEAVQVTAVGDFKIHGVERPISVSGQLKRLSDKVIELEAFFNIKLSEFDIKIPKLIFYELADEQKVTVKAILKR